MTSFLQVPSRSTTLSLEEMLSWGPRGRVDLAIDMVQLEKKKWVKEQKDMVGCVVFLDSKSFVVSCNDDEIAPYANLTSSDT